MKKINEVRVSSNLECTIANEEKIFSNSINMSIVPDETKQIEATSNNFVRSSLGHIYEVQTFIKIKKSKDLI
jgi:multidrug efflux pump subunit AcrB